MVGVMGATLTSFIHNATTAYIAWRASRPFLAPSERLGPPPPPEALPEAADGGGPGKAGGL
jgi:hypothetical protein